MPDVSVIICTHNPRADYLKRVLIALQQQSLHPRAWELVLIDNASAIPVSAGVDLTWHPAARVVIEEKLGLTAARLRGISETATPLIVFVDDDNVLDREYLEIAVDIARSHETVGAWGGNIIPEFDISPQKWTKPYWPLLATRTVSKDVIGCEFRDQTSTPYGAGLCVRRKVAVHYRDSVKQSPIRQSLDRQGNVLSSGGDLDLVQTACDLGQQKGLFARLKVHHLIPPGRVTEQYLLKLAMAAEFSNVVLEWCRSESRLLPAQRSGLQRARDIFKRFTRSGRFRLAKIRGRQAAREFLARAETDPGASGSRLGEMQKLLGSQ